MDILKCLFYLFLGGLPASGILVPLPGVKPTLFGQSVETQPLNWLGKSQGIDIFKEKLINAVSYSDYADVTKE